MLKRVAAIFGSALTAALVTTIISAGCSSSGGDCVSLCTEEASCPGAMTEGLSQDQIEAECTTICNQAQSLADKAGCDGEHDALFSCIGGVSNICDAEDSCTVSSEHPQEVCTGPCGKEEQAFDTCTEKFCADPKNASLCTI